MANNPSKRTADDSKRALRRHTLIRTRDCLEAWRKGKVTDPIQQLQIMNLTIDVLNQLLAESE